MPLVPGVNAMRALEDLEYAAYLKGLRHDELGILFAVVMSCKRSRKNFEYGVAKYSQELCREHDFQFEHANWLDLSAILVGHHIAGDSMCAVCEGVGIAAVDGLKQECPACSGFGRRPLFDKTLAAALGIGESTLRANKAMQRFVHRLRDDVLGSLAELEGSAHSKLKAALNRDSEQF